MHFSFAKLARIREQSAVLDTPSSCRTDTVSWLGKRLAWELRRADTASDLAIEGLALEMLAEASRAEVSSNQKSFPHWLKDAKDFLHDNFAIRFHWKTSLRSQVFTRRIFRGIRENFHCTVGEYIRRLRVEFACRQISTTEITLSEIAAHAGFADQSHFNRIFKSFVNLTPYQYRRLSRAC